MAQPKTIRRTFYRLEQTGNNTFVLSHVFLKDIQSTDIGSINPVNVLGGADIGGYGWLYSKVTLRDPAIEQELYCLQTVLQWETDLNA